MEGVAHALQHRLEGDVPIPGLGKEGPGLLAGADLLPQAVVYAGGVVRVGVQKVRLPLELMGIDPAVVPLAGGEIFSPGRGREHRVVDDDPLGPEVFLLIKGADDVRVFRRVLPQDGGAAVGGDVVVHQHLEGEVRLLGDESVQRLPQIGLVVIDGAEHRYFTRLLFHFVPL